MRSSADFEEEDGVLHDVIEDDSRNQQTKPHISIQDGVSSKGLSEITNKVKNNQISKFLTTNSSQKQQKGKSEKKKNTGNMPQILDTENQIGDNLGLNEQVKDFKDPQLLQKESNKESELLNKVAQLRLSVDNVRHDTESPIINVQRKSDNTSRKVQTQLDALEQLTDTVSARLTGGALLENRIKKQLRNDIAFQSRAVPLITFNNDSKHFEIGEEAKAIAKQIKGPIAVVTVVGMYRTGKSYLLNRVLLNAQKGQGFGVGPTINPCTKGLWMWGTPLKGTNEKGEKVNVIVIDTEGMGGLDEDSNHDMRIFSLALLLSSFFIYNSMGSIDETAISGLNFVTNLTDHIRFKANAKQIVNSNGQESIEQLAEVMPRFLWVVRDFSLQLVDEQEKEINSNQYLEKALKDAVASSGGPVTSRHHQQMNEVKQRLRRFFIDRDCCTIVRPIMDENNLQSLDHLKIEDLRSEFVEQVFGLRKKIMNQLKVKMINGNTMDGFSWIELAGQYIQAINTGCVPTIENSWTYIQRKRAAQIFEELKDLYEQGLNSDFHPPTGEQDLEQCLQYHGDRFQSAMRQKFLEDKELLSEYDSKVKEVIKNRIEMIKVENLGECRQAAQNTLGQLYHEVNQRLMADTSPQVLSQNIKALEFTLQEVFQIYEQTVPEFQEKYLIFQSLKAEFFSDLVYFVHAHLENENQAVNQVLNEIRDRNQSSMLQAKENLRLERQNIESQLKEALLTKAETAASLELLTEQYEHLKSQKEEDDNKNQKALREVKDQYMKKFQAEQTAREDIEEKMQEINREKMKIQSEFEKEKALLDQKVMYLEKNLQEKSSREREYLTNWTSQKSELSNEMRQVVSKLEQEIKSFKIALEEEKERSQEYEQQLSQEKQNLDEKQNIWKEQDIKLKTLLQQTEEKLLESEKAYDNLKNIILLETENKLKEKTLETEDLQKRLSSIDQVHQTQEDELKLKLQQGQKELALKLQKIEFLEIQVNETRDQLSDMNKQHQQMVEALNASQLEREEKLNKDMEENQADEAASPDKIERLTRKLEDIKTQLAASQEKCLEQELLIKVKEAEAERIVKELTFKVEEFEVERVSLAEQLKRYEFRQDATLEQLEQRHGSEMTKLEQELDQKQSSFEIEIKTLQKKSEDSLAQLKQFYEQEKEKLEQRVREERDKAQRKIEAYHEEFELKMRNECFEKDEELDILRAELGEQEARFAQQLTQMQHELGMKIQLVESLERQNKDNRQRIELMESTRNLAFEKQIEYFDTQRHEMSNKIDRLQQENIDKDRQLAQLSHKIERTNEDYHRNTRDLQESSDSLTKERDLLAEKLDQIKKKLSEVQDEAQQNQLIFGRDQALNQQSIEFLQRKIEDLHNQYEDKIRLYEVKLQSIRQEMIEENSIKFERILQEKDTLESKFEQKKKALKEIESQFNKENSELEKKLCLLQEKFTRLDQDKRRLEQEYSERIQEYEAQIHNLDSSAGEAFCFGNAQTEQLISLKEQCLDLETQLNELQSLYDKDRALWEGKCSFLETQKENYKRDLLESQRKFEITLEQLQKRGNSAQDKFEQNQNALTKAVESKFRAQIKEMHESHQQLQQEIQSKSRRLEEENKKLKEQSLLSKKEIEMQISQLQSKLAEAQKQEAIYKNDLQELRNERERKSTQFQSQALKDKENYKQRLADVEKKLKESNEKRQQMFFDQEKEKARWQMEYDNLLNQKRDQDELIANLERRKDILFKENEKLKAQHHHKSSLERVPSNNNIMQKLQTGFSMGLGASLKQSIKPNNQKKSAIPQQSLRVSATNLPPQHPSLSNYNSRIGYSSNVSISSQNQIANTRYMMQSGTNSGEDFSSAGHGISTGIVTEENKEEVPTSLLSQYKLSNYQKTENEAKDDSGSKDDQYEIQQFQRQFYKEQNQDVMRKSVVTMSQQNLAQVSKIANSRYSNPTNLD